MLYFNILKDETFIGMLFGTSYEIDEDNKHFSILDRDGRHVAIFNIEDIAWLETSTDKFDIKILG